MPQTSASMSQKAKLFVYQPQSLSMYKSVILALKFDHNLMYPLGFPAPPSLNYQGYCTYQNLPPKSPIYLYDLHPNDWLPDCHLLEHVLHCAQDAAQGLHCWSGVTREEKLIPQSRASLLQCSKYLKQIHFSKAIVY